MQTLRPHNLRVSQKKSFSALSKMSFAFCISKVPEYLYGAFLNFSEGPGESGEKVRNIVKLNRGK